MATRTLTFLEQALQHVQLKQQVMDAAYAELSAFIRESQVYVHGRGLAYKLAPDISAELGEKIRQHHQQLLTDFDVARAEFSDALQAYAWEKIRKQEEA